MKDHSIAAGVFLLLITAGIGAGAYYGIKGGTGGHQASGGKFTKEVEEIIEIGRSGEYEVAIKRFEHMIEEHPDVAGLYFNLGIAQRAAEKFDEADQSFARAFELDPKDYEAQVERANIQKEKGNADRALEMMEAIPVGEGQLNLRLREDPLWNDDVDNPRMKALRAKHGVSEETDTSLQMQRQKQKNAPQGVMIP